MPLIHISAEEIDEFDAAIAIACLLQSSKRLENTVPRTLRIADYAVPDYFYRQGCLVISFDGRWYPFLDNTRGYNRGQLRWYIPKISELLARVGRAMQSPERRRIAGRAGGRVFLHTAGVVRRPAGTTEEELLAWNIGGKSSYLRDRVVLQG